MPTNAKHCRVSTTGAGSSRPHILHIVADDLGNTDMGFSNALMSSPHLDSLRHCGVRLDNFYAPKACAPSRAAVMTGRYPFHIGIYSNADVDAAGVPTNFSFLPELLRRHGNYATHAVGKWHLGWRAREMTPTHRGFDSFFGFWHCCSDYFAHTSPAGGLDLTRANASMVGFFSASTYAHQRLFTRDRVRFTLSRLRLPACLLV